MRINIHKSVEVDDDAVAKIAENFLEWLDERGLELIVKTSHVALIPPDESYDELAKLWVEDVRDRSYD